MQTIYLSFSAVYFYSGLIYAENFHMQLEIRDKLFFDLFEAFNKFFGIFELR